MSDRIAQLEAQLAAANKRLTEDAKRNAIGMALARAQVKDPNRVYDAIAAQVIENHDGRWVAAENGVSKFGPDEGYTYSLDRLVADVAGLGTKATDSSSPGQGETVGPNPFARNSFNLTAQMILRRIDPAKADHLEYLASVGRA